MNIVDSLLGNRAAMDALLAESWSAPAGPLAMALGIAGERRVVGGKDILDLSDTERVWLILSGTVDLFLVDRLGRYPIAQLVAGGLVDSFPAIDPALRAIAVPSADAEIVATTRAALRAAAGTPETSSLAAGAWRTWFAALAAWLPPGMPAPAPADASFFAARVLHAVVLRRSSDAVDRAAERAAAQRLAKHDFSAGLDSVIDLIDVGTPADREEEAETVASAAERVVKALGLTGLSLRREPSRDMAEAIGDIARDNRLQFRAVELRERWWESDLGPLVATVGTGARPCALLRAGGRYHLHAGGKVRIVDPVTAAGVGRVAYAFYRPFPDGPLTAAAIVRFGLQGGRGDIITMGFTLLLAGLFSLVTPIALGWLMDPIVPDAERGQVGVVAGLLAMLAIGATASFVVESLATLRLEALADNRVQGAVWIRLLNLRTAFFRDYTAGDLASRADSVNAMRKLMSQSFATVASGSVAMLFSLGLMIYYSWRVSLVVACISALFGGVAYVVGRRVLHFNFESLDLAGRLQGVVLQLLGSIAKLRMAGAEQQAFLEWLSLYRRTVALGLSQRAAGNRLLVARSAFGPLVTVIVLVVLGLHNGDLFSIFHADNRHVVRAPLMTTAHFVAFNLALGQFIAAVMSITRGALFVAMLQPHYRRVRPILEATEEPRGQGGRLTKLSGEIELRDVRFRYAPDAPLALRGLSLRVPAGSFVAIVGPSGAGKSSIVRLLLGFDTPESGDIYVDGTDMRLLDLRDLRRRYGVVLQNGRLLAGSIYDNIAAGLPLTADEAMEALRIAALDDVVEALPMGLHTSVAEGGTTFSGGQRQRLQIARAVVRRPRVLIMDEATSALDNVTQRQVVENLRALDCTQIVIAQRLSTIAAADLIYVVDEGRVVESGTYLQLLDKGPLFKKMAARQSL
jgi:NHLM bacteriocin system ABC transporter ATP-binding protein